MIIGKSKINRPITYSDIIDIKQKTKEIEKELRMKFKTDSKIEMVIIDDYTIEMFGRRGWICELCNNFNYETRKKCNRCHINKKPKNPYRFFLLYKK